MDERPVASGATPNRPLPDPEALAADDAKVVSRSLILSSEKLGVIAKIDIGEDGVSAGQLQAGQASSMIFRSEAGDAAAGKLAGSLLHAVDEIGSLHKLSRSNSWCRKSGQRGFEFLPVRCLGRSAAHGAGCCDPGEQGMAVVQTGKQSAASGIEHAFAKRRRQGAAGLHNPAAPSMHVEASDALHFGTRGQQAAQTAGSIRFNRSVRFAPSRPRRLRRRPRPRTWAGRSGAPRRC